MVNSFLFGSSHNEISWGSIWYAYENIKSLSFSDIFVCIFSRAAGDKKSSESTKTIYSPFACLIPAFLAADNPRFFCEKIFIRLSSFAYCLRIFKQLSVEPSFMQIISKSSKVWLIRLSKQTSRYFSTLYTGTITETLAINLLYQICKFL